jgi:hypothetical protein
VSDDPAYPPELEPRIIEGKGRFVAVSSPLLALRIGVVAETPAAARAAWKVELEAWRALHARRLAEESSTAARVSHSPIAGDPNV